MRAVRAVALGAPLALAAIVGGEIVLAVSAEYLPTDPGYEIDVVVGSGPPRTAVELVVLGDSTTAGVGSPTLEESLPVLVAARVADTLGRPVHVFGRGVSGARTEDVRTEQVPRILHRGVDVVLIVVGSNDATHATPWWTMQERTEAMLRAAQAQSDAPVVLGGIPEFYTVPALRQPLRRIVGAYAGVLRREQRSAAAATDASFVDIAALASPRFLGRPESMSSDGFHPAPLGYGFWADALAPAVADAVRARTASGGDG